jgi:hypothetical protein
MTLSASSGLTPSIFGADGSTIQCQQHASLSAVLSGSATNYSMSVDILVHSLRHRRHFRHLTSTVPEPEPVLYPRPTRARLHGDRTRDKLQLIIYGVDGSVLKSGMSEEPHSAGSHQDTDYIVVLNLPT